MKLTKRDLASLSLIFIGYYILTRKEYELPNLSVFIPNTNIFSNNDLENRQTIQDKIKQAIDFKFVTEPKIGWLLSFNPIYGIQIPIKMILPWDIFIAIPQIKEEIGKNIVIKKEQIGNIILGYKIIVNNAKFYA